MVKKKYTKNKQEPESSYFIKLVLYLILGAQWVRIESLPEWSVPIPVGIAIGLWFAVHDHFQIDRKIEYAILLISMFVSFWLPLGLVIHV
jgi:inner membrane protein involved in colicin E2 resistance